MSYKCYMVGYEYDPSGPDHFVVDGQKVNWTALRPGAMYFDDGELCVKLPGVNGETTEWNMDRGRILNARPERLGKTPIPAWTRTGEPPNVTASPSINWQGRYHGWLRDGMLSDDVEGRAV